MKKQVYLLLTVALSFTTMNVQAVEESTQAKTEEQIAEEERCTVPTYAKIIGHEELWKKHNGCPTKEGTKDDK